MTKAKELSDNYRYSEGEMVEISTYNTKKDVFDKGYRYVGRVIGVFEHSILMRTETQMNILVEKTNPSLKPYQGG